MNVQSDSPLTVRGRLAVKTLRGRNGDFNVGRLQCRLGSFWVKERELDQYKEGKYSGEFDLDYIAPHAYVVSGRSVTEVRAWVLRMALDGVDRLSTDDSQLFNSQVDDPADEEGESPNPPIPPLTAEVPTVVPATAEAPSAEAPSAGAPTDDSSPSTTQAPVRETPTSLPAATGGEVPQDQTLFGTLWPLQTRFKLDCTVSRFQIRQQTRRLHKLGYELDFQTQEWHRKAA